MPGSASVFVAGTGFASARASAGIANAAIGVTNMVKPRRQAMKTLLLPVVWGIDRYMGSPYGIAKISASAGKGARGMNS